MTKKTIESSMVLFYQVEDKSRSSQNVRAHKNEKWDFFNSEKKLSHVYSHFEYPNSEDFDEWCKHVESIAIDFQREFNPTVATLELCNISQFNYWNDTLAEFMEAIKDYLEQREQLHELSGISAKSARRFLFLVPVFASHKPRVYIDASNGCVNVDVMTRDNGILSTQISETGQVHYSYVAQNKNIYKITGTAKFKDSRDFIKFNKVLQML